jgi:CDGSH-type Zn-finger protein
MSNKAREMKVTVAKDGPYLVAGGVPMAKQAIGANANGESMEWIEGEKFPLQDQYALCRCGHSKNKPYCDGTHKKVRFDGTETASREPYRTNAQEIDGPTLTLTDAESLCAFGRFCDAQGMVWNRV